MDRVKKEAIMFDLLIEPFPLTVNNPRFVSLPIKQAGRDPHSATPETHTDG